MSWRGKLLNFWAKPQKQIIGFHSCEERKKFTVTFVFGEKMKRERVKKLEREKLQGFDWRVIQNPVEVKFYTHDPLIKHYLSTYSDFRFPFHLVAFFQTHFFDSCSFWG